MRHLAAPTLFLLCCHCLPFSNLKQLQEEPGPAYATWLLPPDEPKVELRRAHVSRWLPQRLLGCFIAMLATQRMRPLALRCPCMHPAAPHTDLLACACVELGSPSQQLTQLPLPPPLPASQRQDVLQRTHGLGQLGGRVKLRDQVTTVNTGRRVWLGCRMGG